MYYIYAFMRGSNKLPCLYLMTQKDQTFVICLHDNSLIRMIDRAK